MYQLLSILQTMSSKILTFHLLRFEPLPPWVRQGDTCKTQSVICTGG